MLFVYAVCRPDKSYLNSYRYLMSKDNWTSTMLGICGSKYVSQWNSFVYDFCTLSALIEPFLLSSQCGAVSQKFHLVPCAFIFHCCLFYVGKNDLTNLIITFSSGGGGLYITYAYGVGVWVPTLFVSVILFKVSGSNTSCQIMILFRKLKSTSSVFIL